MTIRVRDHDSSQDSLLVQEALSTLSEVLTADEEVLYVAMQDQKAPAVRKGGVVATTNRLIFYQPQMVGSFNFQDYHWMDVEDVHLNQGMIFSGFSAAAVDGRDAVMEHLNKAQARKLYSIAQRYEHEWRERRRQRQMEEERARAGGVTIQAPSSAPQHSPQTGGNDLMARLQQAKAMLDAGLITEEEYEQTKARVLSEL